MDGIPLQVRFLLALLFFPSIHYYPRNLLASRPKKLDTPLTASKKRKKNRDGDEDGVSEEQVEESSDPNPKTKKNKKTKNKSEKHENDKFNGGSGSARHTALSADHRGPPKRSQDIKNRNPFFEVGLW